MPRQLIRRFTGASSAHRLCARFGRTKRAFNATLTLTIVKLGPRAPRVIPEQAAAGELREQTRLAHLDFLKQHSAVMHLADHLKIVMAASSVHCFSSIYQTARRPCALRTKSRFTKRAFSSRCWCGVGAKCSPRSRPGQTPIARAKPHCNSNKKGSQASSATASGSSGRSW